jgi:hypothetical protein
MDKPESPFRSAIFLSRAKWSDGSSSTGGRHINPATGSPYSSRQRAMKASASAGRQPAFCGSSPVLT